MEITTPIGWVALIGILLLLTVAIAWSILGTIPTKVTGSGVLIKPGGVFNVYPESEGILTDIRIKDGDIVKKGEIIARISQNNLLELLRQARFKLAELYDKYNLTNDYQIGDFKLQADSIEEKRGYLSVSVTNDTNLLEWYKEKLESRKQLLVEGLVTKQTLNDTEQKIASIKVNIEKTNNQIRELSLEVYQLENQRKEDLLSIQQQINEQKLVIVSLEEKRDSNTKVISPYSGRVLETKVFTGEHVSPGTPITSLELTGDELKQLEAVIYVSVLDGKTVKPGMDVSISPSVVKREEFGFLKGYIISVSSFAVTTDKMMDILNNQNIVNVLAGNSACIEIYADIVPDNNTLSGYKWSSSKGPPIEITSGTMISAAITVKEQAPISMVIPILKKFL